MYSSRQHATSCLSILRPTRWTLQMTVSQPQNEVKSFGEKLIKVATVSYLSNHKLNSVDPDVKKGWSILGGP